MDQNAHDKSKQTERSDILGIDQKKRLGASIPEMASEYGVSEALLYSLANRGALPGCRRLGKRFLIHRDTFEDWIKSGMGDEVGTEELAGNSEFNSQRDGRHS